MNSEYICYWTEGEEFHLTRCLLDINGKPIGLPSTGSCLLIIEFNEGQEPTFYDEAVVTELGIDNTF